MTVTCYNNASPVNKIGKTLTQVNQYAGSLRGPCDIINPVITLETGNIAQTVNYAYIAEFGRYYFIGNMTYDKTGLVTIHCTIDAVETYKNQIKNLTAVIERQENIYDLYLNDPIFRADQQTHTQFIEFANGFGTTPTVLLSTI